MNSDPSVSVEEDLLREPVNTGRRELSLLSFNIQTGVETNNAHEYVTKSWKHLLPLRERVSNLNRIADLIKEYDVVGLQEVDSGSLRTGFLDQTEYLAHQGRFPYWFRQINRSFGKIAQHSNGVLCRVEPQSVIDHKLPGLRGRGAMLVEFETTHDPLVVCIMHLALGKRARTLQMAYIGNLVKEHSQLVVMGDFNCGNQAIELRHLVDNTHLRLPTDEEHTFPSWKPKHKYDHILISESLTLKSAEVLSATHSDHLPISVNIELPEGVYLVE